MASKISTLALRASKIIPQTIKCQGTSSVFVRPMSGATSHPTIKKKQDVYNLDDGKPVFVKGGALDSILYRLTMGLCVLSIALIGKSMFDLATGKKN